MDAIQTSTQALATSVTNLMHSMCHTLTLNAEAGSRADVGVADQPLPPITSTVPETQPLLSGAGGPGVRWSVHHCVYAC